MCVLINSCSLLRALQQRKGAWHAADASSRSKRAGACARGAAQRGCPPPMMRCTPLRTLWPSSGIATTEMVTMASCEQREGGGARARVSRQAEEAGQ